MFFISFISSNVIFLPSNKSILLAADLNPVYNINIDTIIPINPSIGNSVKLDKVNDIIVAPVERISVKQSNTFNFIKGDFIFSPILLLNLTKNTFIKIEIINEISAILLYFIGFGLNICIKEFLINKAPNNKIKIETNKVKIYSILP